MKTIDDLIFVIDKKFHDGIADWLILNHNFVLPDYNFILLKEQTEIKRSHGFFFIPPENTFGVENFSGKIVWEDEKYIGRFRVDFFRDISYSPKKDFIWFRYWTDRLDEKTRQEDPMKSVVKYFYKNFRDVIEKVISYQTGRIVDINKLV